jgi:hypothetical protein
MNKSALSFVAASLLATFTVAAMAQRPRSTAQDSNDPSARMPAPPTAPATVKAKYEGGVFGYRKTMDGTLNFDDTNQRLVFRDSKGKETGIFLPYNALTGAYADTHKVRPKAATIGSNVPFYGWPIGFIKTKVRYDSVLYTLANKAGLDRRGEVFVRKRQPANP